jgi:hypothetical protein
MPCLHRQRLQLPAPVYFDPQQMRHRRRHSQYKEAQKSFRFRRYYLATDLLMEYYPRHQSQTHFRRRQSHHYRR